MYDEVTVHLNKAEIEVIKYLMEERAQVKGWLAFQDSRPDTHVLIKMHEALDSLIELKVR